MYQMSTKCTKWAQNVPNEHKIDQMVKKYPQFFLKIFQIVIKYINIFQYKALQNLPKLVFLDWKETTWPPRILWKISYLLCRPSCSKRFRSTQTVIKILSRNELCFTNFVFILGHSATFSDVNLKRFGYDMV
jgi:hypothetical protein